ncbi:MAG: hypothetical protein AAF772_06610 [Acidobacteriota bacterium]
MGHRRRALAVGVRLVDRAGVVQPVCEPARGRIEMDIAEHARVQRFDDVGIERR